MADEIKDLKTESEDVDDKKVESPAPEKRFTQAEMDKVVRDRLARESASNKTLKEAWETEKTNLSTSIDAYEKQLKEMVKPQLESIPEEYKELVEKLPLLEQVAFIAKLTGKQNTTERKFIPKSPKGSESEKTSSQRPVGTIV
jgi:hypothetical protein